MISKRNLAAVLGGVAAVALFFIVNPWFAVDPKSSSSPSSIYHVALYVGDGMIIQAPRTGRDVEEVSMYYWIAPNYFARP